MASLTLCTPLQYRVTYQVNILVTFNAKNVETQNNFRVNVYAPNDIKNNTNVTLHFEIEKVSMRNLQSGYDNVYITYDNYNLNPDTRMATINYTPPSGR